MPVDKRAGAPVGVAAAAQDPVERRARATGRASWARTAPGAVMAEPRSSRAAATWTAPASDAGAAAASGRAGRTAADRWRSPAIRSTGPPANRATGRERDGVAPASHPDRKQPGRVHRRPDRAALHAVIIGVCRARSASTSDSTADFRSTAALVSRRSGPHASSCPMRAGASRRRARRASSRRTAVRCRASAAMSDRRRSTAFSGGRNV